MSIWQSRGLDESSDDTPKDSKEAAARVAGPLLPWRLHGFLMHISLQMAAKT